MIPFFNRLIEDAHLRLHGRRGAGGYLFNGCSAAGCRSYRVEVTIAFGLEPIPEPSDGEYV